MLLACQTLLALSIDMSFHLYNEPPSFDACLARHSATSDTRIIPLDRYDCHASHELLDDGVKLEPDACPPCRAQASAFVGYKPLLMHPTYAGELEELSDRLQLGPAGV